MEIVSPLILFFWAKLIERGGELIKRLANHRYQIILAFDASEDYKKYLAVSAAWAVDLPCACRLAASSDIRISWRRAFVNALPTT